MENSLDTRLGRLPDPMRTHEAVFYDGLNSRRFFAWVIDAVLILIVGSLLIPFTAFTAIFFFPAFFAFIGFVYRTLTISAGSATFGMRIMGMELRRQDGTKLDFSTAFAHVLLYYVFVTFALIQIASIFLALTSERKQGLHDMLLGVSPIRRSV